MTAPEARLAWRDAALAVAFAAVALVPALGQYGLILGSLPQRPGDGWRVVLILAQTLPLAWRRSRPATCLAVVGVAFAFFQCLAYPPSPAGLGLLFALYSAGAHLRRRRTAVIAASVAGFVVVVVLLELLGSPEKTWQLATFGLVLVAAWGVGDLVRARGVAARARAELAARAAVLEERARLARELHDVVSHHVTGMVVQADAATFLLPDGEETVRGRLDGISGAGRRALADLRRLLDVLGSDDATTTPPIGSLTDLAAQARLAGQAVELREYGAPRGPDDVRLAVYRVAQEGLTNARKHSAGASVQVTADWVDSPVRVSVLSGPSTSRTAVPGSGRGLAGLRERIERLGGELDAHPTDTGGFVLEARIPLGPATTDGDPTDA